MGFTCIVHLIFHSVLIIFRLFYSEALPFFLLLMDLSKAASLAEYASNARSKVGTQCVFVTSDCDYGTFRKKCA